MKFKETKNIKKQLKLLLGMVVFGSFVGVENSQDLGCIVSLDIFSTGNILFLIISSFILLAAIKANQSKIIFRLVCLETAIWIVKYLFYKGGYVTGFGGTANPTNVVYDFFAIGLRLWILFLISKNIKFKLVLSVLISLFFVALKINMFAIPLYSKAMWELEEERTKQQRIEISGSYTGTIRQYSNNEILPIELKIDSNKLIINDALPFNLKEVYQFYLFSHDTGELTNVNGDIFDVFVDRINKDSLIMNFETMYTEKFELYLRSR